MDITFDANKSERNIATRGISFARAADFVWDGALITEDLRKAYGERRFQALGLIGERLYMLVFTPRDGKVHVISLRKANEREGDNMKRKRNPEKADRDNPEWTKADFSRARRAHEVLPKLFGAATAARLLKPRGRPKSGKARTSISLRLPPETLARWKATGPGWQTRMAETLSKAV